MSELIKEGEAAEDDGEAAIFKPALIISLCRFWLVSGSNDKSQLPLEQLVKLVSSVSDDVNVT